MDHPDPEAREAPEPVVLGVREGVPASGKPPVRIYLGSEPSQHRAERVFVWSVERVRDPSRVYEIHLLKGLIGFERRNWTTGFTNYRYAIPHYAGSCGRAIYNDVDQIYLRDPAELFDLDLAGAGYLALTPEDPSVMLLDCARMAAIWSLAEAQRLHKKALIRKAAGTQGLYGPLPPAWHARDEEFTPGESFVLHFTNLHTQPWKPFPERFVYQRHPNEELWFGLERSAEEAGFEVFTKERPSELYARLPADAPLERVPQEDLPWLLADRFATGEAPLRLEIHCDPREGVARGPDGLYEPVRDAAWWSEWLDAVGRRHPGRRWEATLRGTDGRDRFRDGGPHPDGSPPRVWVLCDDRPGNSTQSVGLAEALGWPREQKRLVMGPLAGLHNRLLGASRRGVDARRSDPLAPPWPDLVIAAGRRTAPVALWVKEQSAGRTRLVQLGRKGADHAALFDLAVTPGYCRLFPQPRRIEVHAPLHRVTAGRVEEARGKWRDRLAAFPAPRIALLVGGTSGQYRLDAVTAKRLGEDVAKRAREQSGSVLATASRRTPDAAAEALRAALGDVPGWLFRPGDPDENPFFGFLAWADAFVVTADSESILAEAASLGRPLSIYPLPERRSFRVLRSFREAVYRRATAKRGGHRHTGRPQKGLELWCARALERGFVRPARDLSRLHDDLIRRGVAQRFGEAPGAPPGPPLREAPDVAARVRALLGIAR